MFHAEYTTVEYVMPPLSNYRTASEEERFLCGACLDVIGKKNEGVSQCGFGW